MLGADVVSQRRKLLGIFDRRAAHMLTSAFVRWRDHCDMRDESSPGIMHDESPPVATCIKLPLLKTVRERQRTPIGQPAHARAPISSAPDRLGTNEHSDNPFAPFGPKNSVEEVLSNTRQSHSASGRSRSAEQS